jgi:hypothetical protein
MAPAVDFESTLKCRPLGIGAVLSAHLLCLSLASFAVGIFVAKSKKVQKQLQWNAAALEVGDEIASI